MRKKLLLGLPFMITVVIIWGYQTIFTLSDTPQLTTIESHSELPSLNCYHNPAPVTIDESGVINLLVWNIYKQNRDNWQQALEQYSSNKQLVLLQEASMTSELKQWIAQRGWNGNQVDAFKAFDVSAGVLNLAPELPVKACAYTELEPWLRLPKSALYATYQLSDGQQLAVVNIHGVNFTYGTTEYQRQLDSLVAALNEHTGPIIVAGDFNSWSEQRLQVLKQALSGLKLTEVKFSPDHRVEFLTGLPLDHVFYKGLSLKTAEAPVSDASDHNPLLVQFSL
ncbi:endonuclease/exonuclease/phosphatase family protein [Vibrio sp. TRT 21S02]|uniref:endonuclease/exonuclease/phosphatase family protein n=1 Tax=Vibrio sp. TRT 21S02 TaxID=3418507 RepID=UPI003CF495A4